MARGGGITVGFRIDDDQVLAALRTQRREINQDVKKVTLEAAERTVLPAARAVAPSIARGTLIARSTTRGAYLTTSARGTKRAIVGLLEFGGTVRTPLRPKRARALRIGPDVFVARVTEPRTYRGKRFMRRGVEAGIGRFSAHVERRLTEIMQSRIQYARTFS